MNIKKRGMNYWNYLSEGIIMISQKSFLYLIEALLKRHGIISISGPSGSGKTTLAQFITGHLITSGNDVRDQALWVQASEDFSRKRLETIFGDDWDKLSHLKENVYVIPSNVSCTNFIEQQLTLNKIINQNAILPPYLHFIVIDNISHHMRYELSRAGSIKEKSELIDGFFDSLLLPLIRKCQREKINLILIHEVSYIPEIKKERPFLYKVHDRIKVINIELRKDLQTRRKKMDIFLNSGRIHDNIEYELCDTGFLFC